jgi:hypothetical protein
MALTTPCADNQTDCGGMNPDETDTVYGTSGQRTSTICRATWGNPSTYCFIEAWVWDREEQCTKHGPCSRGVTNSGWCICKETPQGEWYDLEGSCMFR